MSLVRRTFKYRSFDLTDCTDALHHVYTGWAKLSGTTLHFRL